MPTKINAAEQLQGIVPLENLPEGLPTDWNNVLNKPESFPPESHNHDDRYYTKTQVDSSLSGKQDTLVSETNIKTVNGNSLLGSGNIEIEGGGGGQEKKYCRMFIDLNLSTTSGTTKNISGGEVVYSGNDDGMFFTDGRITFTKDGNYLVIGQLTFSGNTTGERSIYIRKNGTTPVLEGNTGANIQGGGYTTVNVNSIISFSVGDYIELRGRQTSGISLDILSIDSLSYSFLQVVEI